MVCLIGSSTISGFSGEFHQFVPPHVNVILKDLRRQRGRVASACFSIKPVSTSQSCLEIAKWCASRQLRFSSRKCLVDIFVSFSLGGMPVNLLGVAKRIDQDKQQHLNLL